MILFPILTLFFQILTFMRVDNVLVPAVADRAVDQHAQAAEEDGAKAVNVTT